jgi:hypothetical protein
MTDLLVRGVSLERTRALRHAVLRPHEAVEEMASSEPKDVFAVGALDGQELVAVGLIAPDGKPGGWCVRGMATAPAARGRGAGTGVISEEFDLPMIGPHLVMELTVAERP